MEHLFLQWLQPPVFLSILLHAWSMYLGNFRSSLLPLSSSQVGWEHHSNCFRYFQRCLVELSPTDIQGHPKPLLHTLFSWLCAYSYLGSCSRWNVSQLWGPHRFGSSFPQWSLSRLLCWSFPRSWLVLQHLQIKSIPTAWCWHHCASLQGWLMSRWWAKTMLKAMRNILKKPQFNLGSWSSHRHFFTMIAQVSQTASLRDILGGSNFFH